MGYGVGGNLAGNTIPDEATRQYGQVAPDTIATPEDTPDYRVGLGTMAFRLITVGGLAGTIGANILHPAQNGNTEPYLPPTVAASYQTAAPAAAETAPPKRHNKNEVR